MRGQDLALLFQIVPKDALYISVIKPEALCCHPTAVRKFIPICRVAVLISLEFVVSFFSMRPDVYNRVIFFFGKIIFDVELSYTVTA